MKDNDQKDNHSINIELENNNKSSKSKKIEPSKIYSELPQNENKIEAPPSKIEEKKFLGANQEIENSQKTNKKRSFFCKRITILSLLAILFLITAMFLFVFLYILRACKAPNCSQSGDYISIGNQTVVFQQNMREGDSFFLVSNSTYQTKQESNRTDQNKTELVKKMQFSVYSATNDTFCYYAVLTNTKITMQQNTSEVSGLVLFNLEMIKSYQGKPKDASEFSSLKEKYKDVIDLIKKSVKEYNSCIGEKAALDSAQAHDSCVNNALTLPYIKYCRHYNGKILSVFKPKLINKFQFEHLFAEIFDFSPKISLESFSNEIKNNTKIRLLTAANSNSELNPENKQKRERSFSHDSSSGAQIEESMKTDSFEVDNLKFNNDTNLSSKSQIELDPEIGSVKNLKLNSQMDFKNVYAPQQQANQNQNPNDTDNFDALAKKDEKPAFANDFKGFTSNMNKVLTTEEIVREDFLSLEILKLIENYVEYEEEITSEKIVNKNGRRFLQGQYTGISAAKFPIANEIEHPEVFGRHLQNAAALPENLKPVDFKTKLDSVVLMGSNVEFYAQNTFYPNEDSMVNNVVAKLNGQQRVIHNSKKDEIGISKTIQNNNFFLNFFNKNLFTMKSNFDEMMLDTKNTFNEQTNEIYDVVKNLQAVESLKQEALRIFTLEMLYKLERNFTNFKQNFIDVNYKIQSFLIDEKKKEIQETSDAVIFKEFVEFNKNKIQLSLQLNAFLNITFYNEIDVILNNITRVYPTVFFEYNDLIAKLTKHYNNLDYNTNLNINEGIFGYFSNKTISYREKYQNKTNTILNILMNFQLLKSIVIKEENLQNIQIIQKYPNLIHDSLKSLENQITREKQYPKLFVKSSVFDALNNDVIQIKNIFDEKFLSKFSKFEKLNEHLSLFKTTANRSYTMEDTDNNILEAKTSNNINQLKFDKTLINLNTNFHDFELKQHLPLIKIYQDIKTNFTAELVRANKDLNDLYVNFTEIKNFFTNKAVYDFMQEEALKLLNDYSNYVLNNLNSWLDSLSNSLKGECQNRMQVLHAAPNAVQYTFCLGFDADVTLILDKAKSYYTDFNTDIRKYIFEAIVNLKTYLKNKFKEFYDYVLNKSDYIPTLEKLPENRLLFNNTNSEITEKIESIFKGISTAYDSKVFQEDIKREGVYKSKTEFIISYKNSLINAYGVYGLAGYHYRWKDKQMGYGERLQFFSSLLDAKNLVNGFNFAWKPFNFTENFFTQINNLKLKVDDSMKTLQEKFVEIVSRVKQIEKELTVSNEDFNLFKSYYDELTTNFTNVYYSEANIEEYLSEYFETYFLSTFNFLNEFILNKKIKNLSDLKSEIELKLPKLSFLIYIHLGLPDLLQTEEFNNTLDIRNSAFNLITNFSNKISKLNFIKLKRTLKDFTNIK